MVFITNASAKGACDSVVDRVDVGSAHATGSIAIYNGTPPADADASLSGNTLLTSVLTQNPAFNSAADNNPGGIATLLGVPLSDVSIDATGTASFGRLFNRDDVCVMQFTVGVSGTNMIVGTVSLVSGAAFTITALTFLIPES